MTEHYGGPPTYRCKMCATNWPYWKLFLTCPDCGTETRAVKLKDEDEEVLTWQEALQRLEAAREYSHEPAPQKGRKPTDRELAEFRARLDFWAFAEGPDDPRLYRR